MRPVRDIVMPASLAGQANGKIDPSLLVAVDDAGNLLESHAALAWHAMDAACFASVGKHLHIGNSYRSYARQMELFEQRFSTAYDALAKVRSVWQGETWYLRAGQSTAAVPGNSNHGFGLAVDTADDTTYHPDVAAWLLEHAGEYGWSWEKSIDASEPWHLHYFAGDDPPYQPEDDDMTPDQLAQAFGGALDTEGRIVVPLADGNLYPLANVLGFIHGELTRDDLLPARIKRVLAT